MGPNIEPGDIDFEVDGLAIAVVSGIEPAPNGDRVRGRILKDRIRRVMNLDWIEDRYIDGDLLFRRPSSECGAVVRRAEPEPEMNL